MIKKITPQNFKKYGWVIEYPKKNLKSRKVNLFRVVLKEKRLVGWRVAYLIVRDKAIKKLEQHPFSFESFEPIFGKSILYVTVKRDANAIESFYLDKPIILKKNIWHGVVTLTRESEMKLTENAQVKCVYWPLGFRLGKGQK